jgi:hypothetical protein
MWEAPLTPASPREHGCNLGTGLVEAELSTELDLISHTGWVREAQLKRGRVFFYSAAQSSS